jgi:hypothetical protein
MFAMFRYLYQPNVWLRNSTELPAPSHTLLNQGGFSWEAPPRPQIPLLLSLSHSLSEALLVQPSFSTLEAALAALLEVVFLGALVWDSALPAAVLYLEPVFLLAKVLEALDTALGPVTFELAMIHFISGYEETIG